MTFHSLTIKVNLFFYLFREEVTKIGNSLKAFIDIDMLINHRLRVK